MYVLGDGVASPEERIIVSGDFGPGMQLTSLLIHDFTVATVVYASLKHLMDA